ncbi:hypothetical protein RhiirA5_427898, partial [Rhizophagus irregularis]
MNEFKIDHKFYGITQNPETKNYVMVLNYKCKKCNYICNTIYFQQNFVNWTSGNNYIDKFVQDTQLSAHSDYKVFENALEWIPYDRFINIEKSRSGKTYRANWIDGNIRYWDCGRRNWGRNNNMIVYLIGLNSPEVITLKFMNKFKIDYEFYGITQNPETKNYMMVLNDRCKKCKYTCNSIHFQRNFKNWTSGNNDIDNFIQDTQLSAHKNAKEALEWIPYDRFNNIEKIGRFGRVFRANWIDGCIFEWNGNWKRYKDRIVTLKILSNSENIALEFMNEINEPYGITQNPEKKNYIMVLSNDKCKKCKYTCNAIHFQQNFVNWTSDNDDIDKFIQDTQLSAHKNVKEALGWIPYDRFNNIEKIGRFDKVFRANWIDGYIFKWNGICQNWERVNQNRIVTFKELDNSKNIILELMKEANGSYGITQNPETKNYIIVLDYICEECNYICNAIHFQQNFVNWTSGNDDVDKFIQDTQLLAHKTVQEALEWIPYYKFNNIEKIGGFGRVFRANWIDGCIFEWNGICQNWERVNQNRIVTLKILSNSENIALEFMNEISKPYGITQNPETKCYMMVLNDKCKN